MRVGLVLGLSAAVVVTGATTYGWGAGWFYPCGPLDGIVRLSNCRVVATLDGDSVEALLPQADDQVLVALRGAGQDPQAAQRLATVTLADGRVSDVTELDGLAKDGSWLTAAASPDGELVAASLLDERVVLIDRATGETRATLDPYYNVGLVAFLDEDRLIIDRDITGPEQPPAQAALVYGTDGSARGELNGAETLPLYRNRLNQAISPDGRIVAQHEETRSESGTVAIRLADAAYLDWAGTLAVAPLATWRLGAHILPELWFSPDGAYLAAAFDSAPEWGKETSALVIWDARTGELLQRVPTMADWSGLVWLDDRRVAASRYLSDTRKAEIAMIGY